MNKSYKVVASVLAVSTLVGGIYEANAYDNSREIKESAITYGEDLNESQKKEMRQELITENGNFKEYDLSTQDVQRYTGVGDDYIYPNLAVEPKHIKRGVSVEIETPDNIKKITKVQYINSAISAGIQNANIRIASVEPTTGEGALTGIYKVYEEQGNALNAQDMRNANDELEKLSEISEQNKKHDRYGDIAMNFAIADMKEKVADNQLENGSVSEQEVRQIVDYEISDAKLDKIISDNQRNSLYNIINNVSQSSVLKNDPEAFKDQLSKYKDYLEGFGMIEVQKPKWEKVDSKDREKKGNFLSNIWHKITG